jgi:hypothetical protein
VKNRIRALAVILFAIPALAACSSEATSSSTSGGGGGSTTGAGGGSTTSTSGAGGGSLDATTFCEASIARQEKCGDEPDEQAACEKEQGCYEAIMRAEAVAPFRDCLASRACGTPDDTCVASVSAAQTETGATMAYGAACTSRLSECEQAGTPFSDDECFGYQLFSDAMLEQITTCFSQPCDQVVDCIDGAIADMPACQ